MNPNKIFQLQTLSRMVESYPAQLKWGWGIDLTDYQVRLCLIVYEKGWAGWIHLHPKEIVDNSPPNLEKLIHLRIRDKLADMRETLSSLREEARDESRDESYS